jgi:hypothetical protein
MNAPPAMPDNLREALGEQPAFVLIDPALCPQALRPEQIAGERCALPMAGLSAGHEQEARVLPFLLALRTGTGRALQLQKLEDWAWRTHGVSWLETPLAIAELAAWLARRLEVTLTQDQAAVLRFSDARILQTLAQVLDTEQHTQFFAPVARWWHFDRRHQLQCLHGAGAMGPDAWPSPWHISEPQELALMQAAEPDTVLALLQEQAPAALAEVPANTRHAFAQAQIEAARHWGIDDAPHQAVFALLALQHGEKFHEQSAWQTALHPVRAKQMNLVQALNTMAPNQP